jgi:hypothetical protein
MIIIYKLTFNKQERYSNVDQLKQYLGQPVESQLYTSGATLRDLGQTFSSTDQGSSSMGSKTQLQLLAMENEK